MAGLKISQLSSSIAPSLSGVTAVVLGGTTYKSSLQNLRQVLVDSGSHVFTGSQVIKGSLTVSGSITAQEYILSSSITHVTTETISGSSNFGNTSDDKHTFTGSILVSGSLTLDDLIVKNIGRFNKQIVVGPIETTNSGSEFESAHISTSGSINVAHFQGNNQYYTQINLKNTNSGSLSSGDIVVTADNGTENVHFVDLGINSSTYNGGYVGYDNDAYLLNVGKDLYIGTVGGTSHPAELKLFANNSWVNPQIIIHTGSQVTFNTSGFTNGFLYEFSGSVKLQNELKVDGSVTASHFVGDGSQLTNLPTNLTNVSMFLSSSAFNTFTSSYNTTSASFDSRIIAATNEQNLSHLAITGSNTFVGNQIISGSKYLAVETIQNLSGSLNLITDGETVQILGSNLNVPNGGIITNFNVSASSLTGSIDYSNLTNVPTPTLISSGPTAPGSAVVANDTDVDINYSGYGTRWTFTPTGLTFPDSTIQTTAFTGIPSGVVSGSSQISYSGLTGIPSGIISGSSQLPSGLVSGSSQISYTGITDKPNGLISGSLQIANLGYAITGSNTFNGVQYVNADIVIGNGSTLYGNKIDEEVFGSGISYSSTGGGHSFTGSMIIQGVSEVITVDGAFNGNRTFDYTSGSIFYLTGVTGNGTWNVQNVPTTNNKAIALTYIIEQGVTPYSGSQYQINGSNVTVKWVDNTIPTGSANNTEIIGLTAFRVGSSWNVIGSLSTFGV